MKRFSSHGSGDFSSSQFGRLGDNVILEAGVLVFHPENIELGNNVYVGHNTILKGYHEGTMRFGDDCLIGQQCFFHSAGGLEIGRAVGIGPGVRILTSTHEDPGHDQPIMEGALSFGRVQIGDGSDLGMGCHVLPGVTIGRGVQVGAGAVVTEDVPDFAVVAGVPARIIRYRDGRESKA
ncbi:MAG: DapH/DapD/GlmU-related protein [Myxococcota bacterium]|nr:DapH/DapD/GlmU-related protein [Myxococcota bacterium]